MAPPSQESEPSFGKQKRRQCAEEGQQNVKDDPSLRPFACSWGVLHERVSTYEDRAPGRMAM
jgi:hypothetical protein